MHQGPGSASKKGDFHYQINQIRYLDVDGTVLQRVWHILRLWDFYHTFEYRRFLLARPLPVLKVPPTQGFYHSTYLVINEIMRIYISDWRNYASIYEEINLQTQSPKSMGKRTKNVSKLHIIDIYIQCQKTGKQVRYIWFWLRLAV